MTTTGVSEANKSILEDKYGMPWHRTPENRAFLGARLQCESSSHPYYKSAGQRGIRFLYDDLDDLLSDVGFRPGDDYCLERINWNGNFEPGNVRWSLRVHVCQKQRPIMQTERSLETMMVRIIQTLKRQPQMEMVRSRLQHSCGSSKWGAATFHAAMKQLITLGLVEHSLKQRQQTEPDGQRPGMMRKVTRTSAVVKLIKAGETQ
jgi:hypothetical protein